MKYENKKFSVKITPLKFAEEFEKNRRKHSKPYYSGGWKTAKCFIRSKSVDEAVKIANWIEFLYSFAQSRSVFFLSWYKYKNGKEYSSSQSKFIETRENRFSELVGGVYINRGRYTKDISLFIDAALMKLNESKEEERGTILLTLHALSVSCSQMPIELKFLTRWLALEKLSNNHYSLCKSSYKSKNTIISKEESKNIKICLKKALDTPPRNDRHLSSVMQIITRIFCNEHNTMEKMILYLQHLDLDFDSQKLEKMLRKLIKVRAILVHCLDGSSLLKTPELLSYLQLIMEHVIFRILGVDSNMQNKLLLKQYNRGTEL